METKTIVLKEFEGKRYEIDLLANMLSWQIFDSCVSYPCYTIIYHGSVSDFLQLPNKEEIAEKVTGGGLISETIFEGIIEKEREVMKYRDYFFNYCPYYEPLPSLMSAIGEYKYFILTESEI